MNNTFQAAIAAAIIWGVGSLGAQAATVPDTCATIDGSTFTINGAQAVGLAAGDVIEVIDLGDGSGLIPGDPISEVTIREGTITLASGDAPFQYTASTGVLIIVETYNETNDENYSVQINCSPTTVPPVEPAPNSIDIVPLVSASAQSEQDSIARSVSQALSRYKGAGLTVSRNGGFFGNNKTDDSWGVWGTFNASSYNGAAEGRSRNLVFGVDRQVLQSDLYVGALLSYGTVSLTNNGRPDGGTSIAVGVYAGQQLENKVWEIALSHARPEYKVEGERFKTRRTGLSASLRQDIIQASGTLSPFITLKGWHEAIPNWAGGDAQTIRRLSATLGARYTWATTVSGMTPYVNFAADAVQRNSDSRGTESFIAPSISAGFAQDFASSGRLTADIMVKKVDRSTTDLTVKMSYEKSF